MNYPQQAQQARQAPSANDALMGGGQSAPSIQFKQPGDGVQGARIISFESRQERAFVPPRPDGTVVPYNERQPLFFPSGDPIYGVVFTVQTSRRTSAEDDGVRTPLIEGKGKKATLRDAILAAGASGPEVGGVIDFVFERSENPADPKARKHYAARYVPAAQAAANAVLGNPVAQPPQPAQQVQYAAAPVAPASPWAPGAAPQYAQQAPAPAAQPAQQGGGIPPWVTQGA